MHLALVTAFHYPDGGPAAARHMALAAGLAAGGHAVTVVLLTQPQPASPPLRDRGVRWLSVADGRAHAGVTWRVRAARGIGRALDESGRHQPLDAALLVDRDPVLLEAGIRAARRRGILALHEITEYPDVVAAPGPRGVVSLLAFERRHLGALDGLLVISRPLLDYVAARTSVPTRLLGSVVDLDDHPAMAPLELTDTLSIGYAGSLSQQKDGVLTLLRAVAKARDALDGGTRLRLELIGGQPASPAMRAAEELRHELGLDDAVRFHGQVPHAEVRTRLESCHALVLPRPVSRQATAGFPTKIGEYLATGRPVVATAVGDIPRYLADGETCLMVAPDDVDALAAALVAVASDYDGAREIGARGRRLVEDRFDATAQAHVLVDFIAQLRERTS